MRNPLAVLEAAQDGWMVAVCEDVNLLTKRYVRMDEAVCWTEGLGFEMLIDSLV